jgi:hypothetical protein
MTLCLPIQSPTDRSVRKPHTTNASISVSLPRSQSSTSGLAKEPPSTSSRHGDGLDSIPSTGRRMASQKWHPAASPDEIKPYPLTPGTQSISSGACFNCGGKHGDTKDMQFDCPIKRLPGLVPAAERVFRSVTAFCYRLICAPTAPTTPVPVCNISVAGVIDVTNTDETYVKSLIDGGAYITEVEQQEKEYGLLN